MYKCNTSYHLKVLDNSSSLAISISDSTIGSYTCRVTVKGYKEISSTAKVYKFGPPKILESTEKIQTGKLRQEASLTCDSFAIPLPDKDITWTYNKNKIVESDRYKINKAAKVDGIVSTLVIKSTLATDFGDYDCSINNGFGEDTLTVRLHRIG